MKSFTTFRGFFGALFGIFLFTWAAFVVLPWLELGHLSPIIDDDNVTVTPWDSSGAAHAGEKGLRSQRLRLLPHPAGARSRFQRRSHSRMGHGRQPG